MTKYKVLTDDGRCIYSGTDYDEAIYQRDEYNYEYNGGAKVHTYKFEGTKEMAVNVAQVILTQLQMTLAANVIMSWGIRGWGAGWVFNEEDYYLPCLILDVSGLIHKGHVIVALNDGCDYYEVALYDAKGNRKGEWHKEVYCDMLGSLLDELIERPKNLSDDEYQRLALADSDMKMLADAMAACK